ncbi:gamma-glutamyltransferase [Pseudonocardia halophobica]|uniref:gamma-glutamyltransferase n=1 Tax=Pseudonocardia halophobica TaxID=29401 RepID=UPI0005676A4C|nr:gamma-glutamyltransferase [Pseudonocardia halophobica]
MDGTVAAPHEVSVRAGLEMLERGGTAVDAAVAAALVAGVVEPAETTLAGSGFLVLADPADGAWSVEFGPRAPRTAHSTMYALDLDSQDYPVNGVAAVVGKANSDGPLATGVPRTLLGLLTAQERFGRLPRRMVLAPAIAAAADGFAIDPFFLVSALGDLGRLGRDAGARATFLDAEGLPLGRTSGSHAGTSYAPPSRLPQPVLAATLAEVADAPDLDLLRTGAVAERIVATSGELGGILTAADLAASAPDIVRPLSTVFRGHEILVPAAPSGGLTQLQALATWQALHPEGGPIEDTAERTRQLAAVLLHAFADRYHWLGDPDVVPVPPASALLAPGYIRLLAEQVRARAVPTTEGAPPWSFYAGRAEHDPWAFATSHVPAWEPELASTPTAGTTHVSVVDAEGRAVSVTHTAAHPFGSAIVCSRTGLLLDSAMAWFNAAPGAANSIRPGARPLANMGPTVITHEGRPVAALGASGGRRIISTMVQLVINLLDRRTSLTDALAAPRVDASGPELLLQGSLGTHAPELADLAAVAVRGTNAPFTTDFARANGAVRHAGGTRSAVDALCFAP